MCLNYLRILEDTIGCQSPHKIVWNHNCSNFCNSFAQCSLIFVQSSFSGHNIVVLIKSLTLMLPVENALRNFCFSLSSIIILFNSYNWSRLNLTELCVLLNKLLIYMRWTYNSSVHWEILFLLILHLLRFVACKKRKQDVDNRNNI